MLSRTRFGRSAGVLALTTLVTLSTAGCWFLLGDDGPAEVTRDFWNAARDGNTEMVQALSVNRPDDMDLDFDSDDTHIRSVSVGETEIDGDEAEVETVIEGNADDRDVTLEFRTALVKRDGEWYVEMGETTGRLVGAMMKEFAGELGEAISEGLGEAMQGLSEGLDEAGQALKEAAEEMRREREERDRNDRNDR